ncbi:MAG: alpha/beta hydrolase-fold protein [Opitutales bacterium]
MGFRSHLALRITIALLFGFLPTIGQTANARSEQKLTFTRLLITATDEQEQAIDLRHGPQLPPRELLTRPTFAKTIRLVVPQTSSGVTYFTLPPTAESMIQVTSIDYYLSSPELEPDQRYPLVLCLHGSGGRFNDDFRPNVYAYNRLQQPDVPDAFLVAPHVVGSENRWGDWRWQEGNYSLNAVAESDEMAMTQALVEHLVRTLPIDPLRVYVTGQSMGGFGTFDLVARYPGYYAAALPMAGGGPVDAAERLAQTPLWFFHGSADEAIDVTTSRELAAALEAIDADYRYTEYRNQPHGIWHRAFHHVDRRTGESTIEWLFAQERAVTEQ